MAGGESDPSRSVGEWRGLRWASGGPGGPKEPPRAVLGSGGSWVEVVDGVVVGPGVEYRPLRCRRAKSLRSRLERGRIGGRRVVVGAGWWLGFNMTPRTLLRSGGDWMGWQWAWGSKRTPRAVLGSGGGWAGVVVGDGGRVGSSSTPRALLRSRGRPGVDGS